MIQVYHILADAWPALAWCAWDALVVYGIWRWTRAPRIKPPKVPKVKRGTTFSAPWP